jgi:hypothetical protein
MLGVTSAASFFIVYKINQSQLKDNSELFAIAFSERFFSSWDFDFFLGSCSTEYRSKLPEQDFLAMINNMKRIGALEEISAVTGGLNEYSIFNREKVTASFQLDSVFKNDSAETYIELVQENNTWKVNNMMINSNFLAD